MAIQTKILVLAILLIRVNTLFADSNQANDSFFYNPFGEYKKANSNSKINMHLLPKGEYEIAGDQWGSIVRVNMLKIKYWSKVPGVKKAWIIKGFEGVEGMAFHPVISEVKDVDADGKSDIFRCRSEHEDARIERLRYDDGRVVWESEPMAALHGDESRLPVFDLDGDGVEDIACHGLGANVDGMFSIWNGKGRRLYAISYLPSPSSRTWSDEHKGGSWSHAMPGGHEGVRRQLDLDGNGRTDFIVAMGAWHWGSDSILFLMECPI